MSMTEHIKDNEKKHKRSNFIFEKEDICKIGLIKGIDAFKEAAEMLVMRQNNEPLHPLEYKEELSMQISNDKEEWTDRSYLESYLDEKAVYLKHKYFGFHFDLGVVCPESTVALQIVDDNSFNFQRRNNLMNPLYKYIGISNKKIGNSFCLYLTFAG